MRLGIDLGGTKIAGIVLDETGAARAEARVATPREDYAGTLGAIVALVAGLEGRAGAVRSVGVGMPGALAPATGLVKNANSTWLNGRPFADDLAHALGRPVRVENDANCLAVSEAVDGAGAGASVVWAIILGTGVGSGIALDGRALSGRGRIAGEWGHNPLPATRDDERPGPACYCGRSGCIETWLSGPGLAADHARRSGRALTAEAVMAAMRAGDATAKETFARYRDRLGRALAHVVNILDPDTIVIGGGLSRLPELFEGLAELTAPHVFTDRFDTPIRPSLHGDASGVRGVAVERGRPLRRVPLQAPLSGLRIAHKHIFMSIAVSPAELSVPFAHALGVLRAAAEETRLRILALLAEGELSVSDLTDILGQSQPRISRHLKLLVEAGLVERHREGAWAFFRLVDGRAGLVDPLIAGLDATSPPLSEDRARREAVRAQRAEAAQTFFARLAPKWDHLRSLHVPEATVEAAVLDALGNRPIRNLIDLGTGTGRMLGLLATRATRATGLDSSHAMLSVARANLERAGLSRVDLRQGDIHAPPFGRGTFDLVLVHQVLHYLDDPARALREAARLVAPGGRLLVVDFAPHGLEFLRETQAHRRLGFAPEQVTGWLNDAGLATVTTRDLAPPAAEADHQLTVTLWLGADAAEAGLELAVA